MSYQVPSKRLDILLLERGLSQTRTQAQALVLAGCVWSGDRRLEKPGMPVREDFELEIRDNRPRFVSRGGEKLAHALSEFNLSVQEKVCLDIGASTGGFTDCLIQNGAKRVFAVDVGYGQLDHKLRNHSRVSLLERENARYLTQEKLLRLHEDAKHIEFICADVSFISLRNIVRPVKALNPRTSTWVLLFKPQFEVGRNQLKRGGRVSSLEATEQAIQNFSAFMQEEGFIEKNTPKNSPLPGKKSGNVEVLMHYELSIS